MRMSVIELEKRYTSGVYPKRDVVIVRGQGARLWDAEGREYIDCVGGHGVAIVGHANLYVIEAIRKQAERLITCPEIFYNDQRALLLKKLAEITPQGLNRVFLCNSGAEAVEGAIKFARLATGRPGIVATMRGFHGRTLGALSATWNKDYRQPFEPLVPGFRHVPYNNLERMVEAVDEETAAVLIEIVQGEGGVRLGSTAYFRGLRALCNERGALLIIDEVQTGFGRTGRMFACGHHDLTPDIMCLGKALGGGVPMGAVILGSKVGNIEPMLHGSTFGGNPLACAASLAAIRYIEEHNLPAQAAEKGEHLLRRLRGIESRKIREVRGLGLMVGVELREKVHPHLVGLMERGVLALPAGKTVLRLLPPLVIERDDLDTAVDKIAEVLAN